MIRIYVCVKFFIINLHHNSLKYEYYLQQCYNSLLYTIYIKFLKLKITLQCYIGSKQAQWGVVCGFKILMQFQHKL